MLAIVEASVAGLAVDFYAHLVLLADGRWPVDDGPSASVLAAPAVVTGLNDVAVVGEAIEERGRHLGIAEHAGPFPEGEIGSDDDGGAL